MRSYRILWTKFLEMSLLSSYSARKVARSRFLALLLMLMPAIVSAQDVSLLDKFNSAVAQSCMEVDYSYTARVSGVENKGSGALVSQGFMWKLQGNGVQMYCDAESLWVIDPAMKEVVIEPAQQDAAVSWLTNPAMVFSNLMANYLVTEALPSKDGKSVVYALKPKTGKDVSYCNVEIYRQSALLKNATVALVNGTLIKIEVSSMKLTPKVSDEAFRPQMSFDSSWIVTDLR